jgi:Holliday junction resolvasome RuvABC endonuclease subunit
MVFKILGVQKDLKSKDAVDALAIAIAGEIKSEANRVFNTLY